MVPFISCDTFIIKFEIVSNPLVDSDLSTLLEMMIFPTLVMRKLSWYHIRSVFGLLDEQLQEIVISDPTLANFAFAVTSSFSGGTTNEWILLTNKNEFSKLTIDFKLANTDNRLQQRWKEDFTMDFFSIQLLVSSDDNTWMVQWRVIANHIFWDVCVWHFPCDDEIIWRTGGCCCAIVCCNGAQC